MPADECPEGFTDVVYYDPSLTPKITILSTSRPSTPSKQYFSEDTDASDANELVPERDSPKLAPEPLFQLKEQELPVKPESNLKDWILNHPVDSEIEELPGEYSPLNTSAKKKKKKITRDTTRPSDEIIAARRKIKELIKQEKDTSAVKESSIASKVEQAVLPKVSLRDTEIQRRNTAKLEESVMEPANAMPVNGDISNAEKEHRHSDRDKDVSLQQKMDSRPLREASPDSVSAEIDIFDETNPDFAPAPSAEATTIVAPLVEYIELIIPKSWLGNTPVKLLRTTCKSKNYGNFRFFTLPKGLAYGYRLGVDIDSKGQFIMKDGEICRTRREAEEYVALKALFEIYLRDTMKTQTYTTLPENCKVLWKDWQVDAETADQTEQIAKEEQHARDLEEVCDYVSQSSQSPLSKEPKFETVQDDVKNVARKSAQTLESSIWKDRIQTAKYRDMYVARQQLPMFTHRSKVTNALRQSRVVILSGETGCGKSTQLPQFILEEWAGDAFIVCAQPRRISAISLASRVSCELADSAPLGERGTLVGYAVRFDTKISSDTRILYCTLGVATRMLENNHESARWTHLVIDEVHERNLDSDFLIAVVKDLLRRNPSLRIALMSATLTASLYLSYFEDLEPVHVHVPGRTFPVQNKFLEDIIDEIRFVDAKAIEALSNQTVRMKIAGANGRSSIDVPVMSNATSTLEDSREVNFDLLEHLITYILYSEQYPAEGSILVFLPGAFDIDNLASRLSARKGWYVGLAEDVAQQSFIDSKVISIDGTGSLTRSGKVWITTCHSKLTNAEQARVFEVPPIGIRKIVLSTNIAETGITIPDVTHVIGTLFIHPIGLRQLIRFNRYRIG